MPSGEQGSPRTQELLPLRMTHVAPASGDYCDDEPFDFWAEDIDCQCPSNLIASEVGGPWASFTVLCKDPDYMMKERALRRGASSSR